MDRPKIDPYRVEVGNLVVVCRQLTAGILKTRSDPEVVGKLARALEQAIDDGVDALARAARDNPPEGPSGPASGGPVPAPGGPPHPTPLVAARSPSVGAVAAVPTGNLCTSCGSGMLVPNGGCLVCRNCGTTTGCS